MTWSQLASTAFLLTSSSRRGFTPPARFRIVNTPPSPLPVARPFVTPSSLAAVSSPTQRQTTTDSDRFQSLRSWFETSHHQAYVSPKYAVSLSPSGDGYGAFAATDVREGERLLAIPRSTCVTIDDVVNDAECGEAFRELLRTYGPGATTVALAGYLAKELLLMREGKDVKRASYLRTLPWARGINGQEHVLFLSDEEAENLLRGNIAYEPAMAVRSEVKRATKVLRGIIEPAICKARGNDSAESRRSWSPWEKRPPPSNTIDFFDEVLTGAFVCVLTRLFNVDLGNGEEEEMLEPIIDMLQHSENPSVSHSYDKATGIVEMRACRDISQGEEFFTSYRKEDDVDLASFFARFGFVPVIEG